MIKRAAGEIKAGMVVNLGIGLPTKMLEYIAPDLGVCLHSENGIAGVGPGLANDKADRNLIDAGGTYVSTLSGAVFFDSAISFSLVRRGRLDLTVLGAFEVAVNGDLANWKIPGLFTPGPGGAIELAQKARRVVILTTHQDKHGRSKIVRSCTLPVTAIECVDRVYTDMAVLDITENGIVLREIAEGLSIDEVIAATDAPLLIPDCEIPVF
ncbi:MAG TPA: 3-oxoacid CoA-transferase subunit B [Rhizobiales bacterium]|nr:3-oxoacid CoA-transferase subunit B [Hyphomicrobiales bacterium]